MKHLLGKAGKIKQILLLRLLIAIGIIAVSGGFWEMAVMSSDYSILIMAGMIDATLGVFLYLTTKVSNKEKQETIRDLFAE